MYIYFYSFALIIAMAIYSRSPAAYSAVRSLGIIHLPCSKTVKERINETGKHPGINEQDLLKDAERYKQFKEEKKKTGSVSPAAVGVLIWDETKVCGILDMYITLKSYIIELLTGGMWTSVQQQEFLCYRLFCLF